MWKSGRGELGGESRCPMVLYAEAVNFYVKDSGAQLKTFKLGYDMIRIEILKDDFLIWRDGKCRMGCQLRDC